MVATISATVRSLTSSPPSSTTRRRFIAVAPVRGSLDRVSEERLDPSCFTMPKELICLSCWLWLRKYLKNWKWKGDHVFETFKATIKSISIGYSFASLTYFHRYLKATLTHDGKQRIAWHHGFALRMVTSSRSLPMNSWSWLPIELYNRAPGLRHKWLNVRSFSVE